MAKSPPVPKENLARIQAAERAIAAHPLLGYLAALARVSHVPKTPFPKTGWARIVISTGHDKKPWMFIEANAWQRGTPAEWMNVLGQAYLHIALNHIDPKRSDETWRYACELSATELLASLGIAQRPETLEYQLEVPPGRTVDDIARNIATDLAESRTRYGNRGLAGDGQPTWIADATVMPFDTALKRKHADALADGIRSAVSKAVETAGVAARGPATKARNPKDRKSTRLNSSHVSQSRIPSSA